MDKKCAVKIITDAVKIYDNIYCGRNLLIIFGSPDKPLYIETAAEEKNFFHLTGIKLNKTHLLKDISDKNSNVLSIFYLKAKRSRLSVDDFEFKDGSTVQKLQVLIQTLQITRNLKMFGDYSEGRINLKTDKLAGSVSSFLGFVKTGRYYVPNTVMADDIRNNSRQTQRVLAVLSKKTSDLQYDSILSVAKSIDIKRLSGKIIQSVPIDKSILNSDDDSQVKSDT